VRKNYFTNFSFLLNTIEKKTKNLSDKIGLRKNCSLFILFFALFLTYNSYSQTTLISATGNGNFETGFATNGWTATINGTRARWVREPNATAGFTGTYSAYISNSTGAPYAHNYNNTASRTAHLYKDITVPAGETTIQLNFNWIGNGEVTYDFMSVWLVPTSYTPVHGTAITATGTAPSGRIKVGLTEYSGQAAWTNAATVTIPAAYAGTSLRLVFQWENDGSDGLQPPAAIDNVSLISAVPPPAITNNEPCSATVLSVGTSCAYTTYTNVGATASAGIPAPGCANYVGEDVWFTAIVPANGIITIDTQAGGITDSGMALYSGAVCGTLSLIECDDDDSANGAMSSITLTGRTPGETLYIRMWVYDGDPAGTFGICASSPAPLLCPNNPSALVVTPLSQTTATVTWTAAAPAPASGYQYYLSTSPITPGASPTPLMDVVSGTTGSLTGLTSGFTYYIWVRSNCGGGLGQGTWVGSVSFVMPNCTIGNHTGTTTLGCPEVVSGGLNLNGADPAPVTCISASTCVDLEAKYLTLGQTTDYTVEPITGAFNPPYQFGCLQNPVSVNIDDTWSPIITLPFNFCFYGNTYNQCLISSNGVISFDIAGNTPGGYSTYLFSNNLPNTSLFRNAIFGVYHDIDPSKGGEVGWELITLNTGCRALVASWKDIPMFDNNSLLYTGMMVLYENTNVIEVYIKEKRVVPAWNGGNAIVGVQNAAGTQAVVAPGRNGLDTDWTVVNEAWRFVPAGSSITTVKWYEGAGTAGPVVGTQDDITVCPSATTVYTAEITYTLCGGATLKELDQTTVTVIGSKVWNGSVSNNWNVANNWTPAGVPAATDCVVIPDIVTPNNDAVVTGAGFNGLGHNLTVQPAGNLTLATPNSSLTITDKVSVSAGGIFTINDAASLIQTNNVINTGNISMQRTAFVDRFDYVYWSTPVTPFSSGNISPTATNTIYKWEPTTAAVNGYGNWVNGNETMVVGKGYIERGLNSSPLNSPINFTATFTGVPNNGNISTAIRRGTYTGGSYTTTVSPTQANQDDDNWNLIGNPYPSAISANAFLDANTTNLAGFVKIWTHGLAPTQVNPDPFYNNYGYNYNSSDYFTWNRVGGSTGPAYDGHIAAGQSFIVKMLPGSPTTSSTAVFNNSMRSSTYNNNQFYKNATANTANSEQGRIWLDIVSPTASIRTLIGYVDGATNGNDQLYDADTDLKMTTNIYSLINYDRLTIQGRALPFDQDDQVPLAVKVPQNGSYTIAIGAADGFLANAGQPIYLEDKLLNAIHDLRSAPYSFTTNAGEFIDRFVLRYTQASLSNDDFDYSSSVSIYTNSGINIKSASELIKEITVYDLLGKVLCNKKKVGQNEITLNEVRPTTNTLIVKVLLDNNKEVIKKIIY
jgi:hypothetical protein